MRFAARTHSHTAPRSDCARALRCSRFKEVQEQEVVPYPAATPASEGPKRAAKSPGLSAGATSPASPALVPLEVGQSVDARFGGRSRWFPGVVQHLNEDGTLAINYDDGDQEKRVLHKHVRPSKSKASKETSVPNGSASKETGVPNGSAARAAEPLGCRRSRKTWIWIFCSPRASSGACRSYG